MPRQAIDATDTLLDEPLPDDVAANTRELLGLDAAPETVGDWAAGVRETVREEFGRDLAVEDLCHTDDGDHVVELTDDPDADTYRFACFLDGLVLAGMKDVAVAVETPCPETGDLVTFEGTLDDLSTDAAVVSIGVATDPRAGVDDEAALFTEVYGVVCPYVKAFPSRDAYEAWDAEVDAATTVISPGVALAATRTLVN